MFLLVPIVGPTLPKLTLPTFQFRNLDDDIDAVFIYFSVAYWFRNSVHAVSKDYPLDTFGRIPWIILGLSPLRNHIPSATTGEGKMLRTTRGRWRSNSLPSPQTPDESCPAELNPSLSVCFDLNQASYTPSTLLPGSYGSQSSSGSSSGSSSSGSPPNSNNLNILHRHKSANANGNGQNNGSTFFRQAPQRSLHSLMRARLQCLYATSRRPCKVTVCLYFGSNPCPNPSSTSQGNHRTTNSWNLKEALLVAVNDGQPSDEDSWLIGGSGFSYIVADNEYRITLTNGLAADGVYHTPVATFNKLRLIRQWSKWSESVDGEAVWPQAYVEVEDLCDPRIGFVLGPVMFERDGMQGKEWVGEIPSCIQC